MHISRSCISNYHSSTRSSYWAGKGLQSRCTTRVVVTRKLRGWEQKCMSSLSGNEPSDWSKNSLGDVNVNAVTGMVGVYHALCSSHKAIPIFVQWPSMSMRCAADSRHLQPLRTLLCPISPSHHHPGVDLHLRPCVISVIQVQPAHSLTTCQPEWVRCTRTTSRPHSKMSAF
jgi:hypothetical protein